MRAQNDIPNDISLEFLEYICILFIIHGESKKSTTEFLS